MPTAARGHRPPSGYTSKNKVHSTQRGSAGWEVEFGRLRSEEARRAAAWRAAASHRLRCLMWETQFGKRREAERETGGTAQKPITVGPAARSPGCFRVTIPSLGRHTPVNLQGFSTKAYFLKILTILLAKQSLRTSKMATRNTSSSSDALLDTSPAHLGCDWLAAAVPALLFVKACCPSEQAVFTTSCTARARIGQIVKVKAPSLPPSSAGRNVLWEIEFMILLAGFQGVLACFLSLFIYMIEITK